MHVQETIFLASHYLCWELSLSDAMSIKQDAMWIETTPQYQSPELCWRAAII
jgi:hypothetical protein